MKEADLKLVVAAQDGDRTAFGQLVETYKGRVYAMSLAISGDRDEAQELTQETFVRAMQSMPRLQAPEKFPSWLRGITATVGQDMRRRAARERRHSQAAGQIRPHADLATDVAVADGEALAKEQMLLADLVASLPENCRIAIDLRFREDLSYAQIGQVMGVPASTVRGLLYRGTKALRQKMKPMLKRTRGIAE